MIKVGNRVKDSIRIWEVWGYSEVWGGVGDCGSKRYDRDSADNNLNLPPTFPSNLSLVLKLAVISPYSL